MKQSEFNIHRHCGTCKKSLALHDNGYFGSMCLGDHIPFDDETEEEIEEWKKWDIERKNKMNG